MDGLMMAPSVAYLQAAQIEPHFSAVFARNETDEFLARCIPVLYILTRRVENADEAVQGHCTKNRLWGTP